MASPAPNQRYAFPEYSDQPPLQPVSSVPDHDYRHVKTHTYPPPNPRLAPPAIYVQPQVESPPIIAELPAPRPPAPPTSTSSQQLNEDELLAHRLQQMEVAKARSRSQGDLRHHHSQYSLNGNASLESQYLAGQPYRQPSARPHSISLSSHYGQQHYAQASQLQLSPYASAADLAPEVAPAAPPLPPRPVSMHAVRSQQSISPPNPTAHLPPAPTDPASLSVYLEQHRQVTYPPQWILPPVTETHYGSLVRSPNTDWLDTQNSQLWHTTRFSDPARNTTTPTFKLSLQSKGGAFRDPRFSWAMTTPSAQGKLQKQKRKQNWSYHLKLDDKTSKRKEEFLVTPKGMSILCTYVHAMNYDTLRFLGPDGRTYKWVSHAPVSSMNGSRFDTIRHALFVSTERNGSQDPLYGRIVADHTYWDGFVDHAEVHEGVTCHGCNARPINGLRWTCKNCPDHDVCESCRLSGASVTPTCDLTLVSMPDEALYIRSSSVDVSMVVATLQVMKDWEKITLREEKKKSAAGFEESVEAARRSDLGRMSYWRSSDFEGTGIDKAVHGTLIAAQEQRRKSSTAKPMLAVNGAVVAGEGVGELGVDRAELDDHRS